ncbi:MAG: hypothetical protein JJ956_01195 [Pseudomonadales bacterium]|nr:hypothetical protein [Pseudomonadales bacterium]
MTDKEFPWYDGGWLRCYHSARQYLGANDVSALATFEQQMAPLRTRRDFKPLLMKNLIQDDILTALKTHLSLMSEDDMDPTEFFSFGRLISTDVPILDELQEQLATVVANACKEKVERNYNFLSLYNNFGICEPHMDAPEAKWTLDICIDQSEPWPIYLSDTQEWPVPNPKTDSDLDWKSFILSTVQFREYTLMPGDALLFSGSSQWHYRNRIEQRHSNNYCHLAFLHYVPEGCRKRCRPRRWASLFEQPGLATLPAIEDYISEYESESKE